MIGRTLEMFVLWARALDSQRAFPFEEHELTRSQVEVLFLVAHAEGEVTPGQLAKRLAVTPGAVTQLVAGLSSLGLIEQRTHTRDARRRVLELSPGTRRSVERFELDAARGLAPRFDGLDDDELRQLSDLLGRTVGEP